MRSHGCVADALDLSEVIVPDLVRRDRETDGQKERAWKPGLPIGYQICACSSITCSLAPGGRRK